MAHPADKKREARRRYVIERLSLPGVEAAIGVRASTISKWKREAKAGGDDWEQARKAHLVAGEGLESIMAATAERFVTLASTQMDRIDERLKAEPDLDPAGVVMLLASLSDAMSKAVSAAGRLAPRISQLGVAQDVLQRQAAFVEARFPEHVEAFLEILKPFSLELAKAYDG